MVGGNITTPTTAILTGFSLVGGGIAAPTMTGSTRFGPVGKTDGGTLGSTVGGTLESTIVGGTLGCVIGGTAGGNLVGRTKTLFTNRIREMDVYLRRNVDMRGTSERYCATIMREIQDA